MKKQLYLLFLLLPGISFSQIQISRPKRCGTDEVLKNYRLLYPNTETDQQFESWLVKKKSLRTMSIQATQTLPVVFHIIHSGESEGSGNNISQAQVQQQILQLNKDFANQSNSPYSVAANTNIQFALAQRDPLGNTLAQPGIDRIHYSSKSFSAPPYTVGYASAANNYLNNTIKPATYWDPSRYINIWVLEMEAGVLGIATFPQGSTLPDMVYSESNQTAGIAVGPATVGSIFLPGSDCGTYTKGKTLTHEMGHFLGLRHIWGDGDCGNDYCGDTPVHQASNRGMPAHPKANSCGTTDEMFENYMDYSDDEILNTFTADQVARMQTVLANSPRRSTLPTSNVGMVSVSATNRISFNGCGGILTVSETGNTGTSPRYRDYSFTLNIEDKATGNATITMTTSGTAVSGVNYQVMTPTLNIMAGDNYKNVIVRVFDNALVESNKTLLLGYTISGTGVQTHTTSQSMIINILDNDNITVSNNTVTLLSEDFTAAPDWSRLTGGGSNQFVIGSNGNAGGSGNAAYITNNGNSNTYSATDPSLSILQTPLINATGISNLQLTFKYRVYGEADVDGVYDYGDIVYSPVSNQFSILDFSAAGKGPYVGTSGIVSDNPFISLPDNVFANQQFYLGFLWENDDNIGNDPGLNIDDVLLTGTGTGVETNSISSYGYDIPAGTGINNIRSTNNRAVVSITNASTNLSGVTASITAAGTGQVNLVTTNGTFQRTQKVFQVTPSVANSSATYRMTLYFTPAELAIWGASKLGLKILKVKDGVSLSGIITGGDAVLVDPVSAVEDAAAGVITYTADFTNGFSQFVLVSSNTVLPASLTIFEAKPAKNSIGLTWETTSEQNNKGFYVERSTNGADFTTIGWVQGVGTTTTSAAYHFMDNGIQANITYYYRLRQVDLNNRSSFSQVRQAKITTNSLLVIVSPNPAKDKLKVSVMGSNQVGYISLINAKGQTVGKWSAVNLNSPYTIDISQFARGYYTLVVHLPGGTMTERVIIQ